jgi:hypothetical protein
MLAVRSAENYRALRRRGVTVRRTIDVMIVERPGPPRGLSRSRQDTGAHVYLPFISEERAALAALLGDDAGRARHLRDAHRLFVEIGAAGHAARLARAPGPSRPL